MRGAYSGRKKLPGTKTEQLDDVTRHHERIRNDVSTAEGRRGDELTIGFGDQHVSRRERSLGELLETSQGDAVGRTGAANHDLTTPADDGRKGCGHPGSHPR
jgi:hypothetical protein